jgi:hypothetical protein
MKSLFLALLATFTLSASAAPMEADLCIYGGTSAGVIAAVQAATMGKMVEMLDSTPFVERYAVYNWVEDVRRVREWGADAILVGEALMRSGNPGQTIQEFMAIV